MKRLLHYQILVFITHGKIQKTPITRINLKYLHQHGMINLNYQMDRILYQIFKIILSIFKNNTHGESVDKPLVQIYGHKIENRVTFKIKNRYSLALLAPEIMKLLGSTKKKKNN